MRVVLGTTSIGVEVKAPFRERPNDRVWRGDDSDKIAHPMEAANKQFCEDQPNLLVLVPCLRWAMFTQRHNLVKAAFGQSKITWQVDFEGGAAGPAEAKFFPDGKFLNTERPGGAPLKPDGFPGYRRISAVVCIEETIAEKYSFPNPQILLNESTRGQILPLWERARDLYFSADNEAWVDHEVLVLHNPYAYHPLSREMWDAFVQLVPVGDVMQWTDGQEVIV